MILKASIAQFVTPKYQFDFFIIQFFERLEMFQEESEFNRRAIAEQLRREESENIEKQLAFQNTHRNLRLIPNETNKNIWRIAIQDRQNKARHR